MEDSSTTLTLDKLRARLDQIEQRLDSFRVLLHEKECIEKAISALEQIGKVGVPPATIWEAAKDILSQKGKPMTAKQITDALIAVGVQVEGKHRMENVRVALIRKPEVIERLPDGRFQLKK